MKNHTLSQQQGTAVKASDDYFSFESDNLEPHEWRALEKYIDRVIAIARRQALQQAARDVCPYCDGQFESFNCIPAGPNKFEQWNHTDKDGGSIRRYCIATGIYKRLAAESAKEEAA